MSGSFLPNQIADEFLRITAPWKQQNICINEALGKQYEKYNVLKEMRAKQSRGLISISEANNMSQKQKDQKVAALDATSKQLRELSGKIEEYLARKVSRGS